VCGRMCRFRSNDEVVYCVGWESISWARYIASVTWQLTVRSIHDSFYSVKADRSETSSGATMIHSSCARSVMIPGDYLLRTTRSWYECEDDRSRIWVVSFRRIYYGEPHIYVSWMFNVRCSPCIFGETWY